MLTNTREYLNIVKEIRSQIANSRQRIILNANKEILELYWNIGNTINKNKRWGDKFIENLAQDIKNEFPDLRGFSARNMGYMIKFATIYEPTEILQPLVAKFGMKQINTTDINLAQSLVTQLSWRHHIILMDNIKDNQERYWYIEQAATNGWSSRYLENQIESNLYQRQVTADKTTNFKDRLPAPQSDLAQNLMKDPFIFDIMSLREGMIEREIEKELVGNITKFLLELGTGFAFVGEQYHLDVGGQDFYIDLLFYHLKLRCFVVMELKNNEFKPEYAGKLNFYISAVDDILKHPTDNPTIGILLCKKKNKVIAEYALRNVSTPISINEFKLLTKLPKEYENLLPTAKDIETRFKLFDKNT